MKNSIKNSMLLSTLIICGLTGIVNANYGRDHRNHRNDNDGYYVHGGRGPGIVGGALNIASDIVGDAADIVTGDRYDDGYDNDSRIVVVERA